MVVGAPRAAGPNLLLWGGCGGAAREISGALALFKGCPRHIQRNENGLSQDERMAACDWPSKKSSRVGTEDILEKKCTQRTDVLILTELRVIKK